MVLHGQADGKTKDAERGNERGRAKAKDGKNHEYSNCQNREIRDASKQNGQTEIALISSKHVLDRASRSCGHKDRDGRYDERQRDPRRQSAEPFERA
jgi:hypothetical protein